MRLELILKENLIFLLISRSINLNMNLSNLFLINKKINNELISCLS